VPKKQLDESGNARARKKTLNLNSVRIKQSPPNRRRINRRERGANKKFFKEKRGKGGRNDLTPIVFQKPSTVDKGKRRRPYNSWVRKGGGEKTKGAIRWSRRRKKRKDQGNDCLGKRTEGGAERKESISI